MYKVYMIVYLLGKVASYVAGWPTLESCNEGKKIFENGIDKVFENHSTVEFNNKNGYELYLHHNEVKVECKILDNDPELEY